MSDDGSREALERLIDAHVDDLLEADPEDLLVEARERGVDLDAVRRRHMDVLERATAAVGRERMAGARAAVAARKSGAVTLRPTARGVADARAVTLAARNGTEQSARDRQTVQEDLDELDTFRESDVD